MGPVQRIVLVALGVVCLCAPWAGAQCILTNESFDTFTGTDLDVWVESAPSPAIDNDTTSAHSGDGYLIFDTTTLVSVEQPVVIPLAEVAEVTFFAWPVGTGDAAVRVLVDGTLIATTTRADIEALPPFGGAYTVSAISVDISDYADGESHVIRIEGDATAGNSILLDDVCLTVTNPTDTACSTLVDDPSFEAGTPSVNWDSGPAVVLTEDAALANIGQWFARFIVDATLRQSVTLPTSADPYELTFQMQMVQPAATDTGTFTFSVDGVVLRTWTEANQLAYNTYSKVTIDVSAYDDAAPHDFTFSYTPGATSTGNLEFRVDDVCILNTVPEPINACPTSAVSLLIEGDFEPDTCPDPVAEPLVIAAWDGDPDGVITTCQDPAVDGNGGSNGFANFETPSSVSQSGIVLSDDIGAAWLSLWVKMPADVIDGQTLKVILVNEVTTDELQIWPNATLEDADLTEFYNDTFGGTNAGTYVNVVAIISSLTADPTAHTLRIESEGSAEWFVDDLCVFGGGGFCSSGGTPFMRVISSIVEAELDDDAIYPDNYVGRDATMLIELQYPANVLSVCVGGGQVFQLETEAGELFPLNDYLAFANPDTGLIQFQVPLETLDDVPPIDGITEVLIDAVPIADTFIIDTVPPIVGPAYANVNGVTPVLQTVLDTAALPGLIGTDFMDLTAFISDTLTGSAAAPATVPAVNNPLQPGNFTYTPWNDVFTPDNRILTYATRSGRFAKVFFNDVGPLEFSLLCEFYDPPLYDDVNDVALHVSGFSTDPLKYDLQANVTPTAQAVPSDSTQAPLLQDTDTANGFVENHATAYWDALSFPVPTNAGVQNTNYLNVRCSFHAMDRAGNVRAPQEEVLDGVEFWWMERAQSRLTPNWSSAQPTPDEIYFDFAMDRTYEPSPLGAPLPIFNVSVEWTAGTPDVVPVTWTDDLGWIGWTPARRLTSAYFQDLVASDPTYANGWFRIGLIGADEAGNFEAVPNYQSFYLKGAEAALDTTVAPHFWYENRPADAAFGGQGEVSFGAANILPFPQNPAQLIMAEFLTTAIAPIDLPGELYIRFELEDVRLQQIVYSDVVGPFDAYGDTRSRIYIPTSATGTELGDPNIVKEYVFRATTIHEPPSGVRAQDPTPATFRFRVVPGSVQQYLEDFNDPQDQPIKELQRIE